MSSIINLSISHYFFKINDRHNLPKVKLTVCRRANKTVTLVDNLDLYGIPTTEVAHQIQKQAACHSAGECLPRTIKV